MPFKKNRTPTIPENKANPASENRNVASPGNEKPSTGIDKKLALLKRWLNGIEIAHIAHCKLTAEFKDRGRRLGLIVTIFTTIIGTSIFASLNVANNQIILAITGLISLVAAILSGVNTFLGYSDLAVAHNEAGGRWGELRRHVEDVIATVNDSNTLDAAIDDIRIQWNKLSKETPAIPEKAYTKAQQIVNKPKTEGEWK